jgi:DNA replication protein DnaC
VLATAEKEKAGPLDPAQNSGFGGISFSVAVIRAVDYAEAIRTQFSSDSEVSEAAYSVMKKAKTVRWLLLDDLGKSTHTPAVASALFALIDHRHNENLVTIWTANSKPAEFLANIPSDLADPLRGRLLECSTTFQLK